MPPMPGCAAHRPHSREIRHPQITQQQAAIGVWIGAHASLALPAPAPRSSGAQSAQLVEQLFRPVTAQPLLQLLQMRSGSLRTRRSAPGAQRNVPSTGSPSTRFGPVQPFGVRSTIIGQRGRSRSPCARASLLDVAGSASMTRSSVAAISLVHQRRARGLRRNTASSRSLAAAAPARRAGCAPAPSDWRSCSRSDAESAARRRR